MMTYAPVVKIYDSKALRACPASGSRAATSSTAVRSFNTIPIKKIYRSAVKAPRFNTRIHQLGTA